jgi:hypothetical protein
MRQKRPNIKKDSMEKEVIKKGLPEQSFVDRKVRQDQCN